jgi:hypothetical protein
MYGSLISIHDSRRKSRALKHFCYKCTFEVSKRHELQNPTFSGLNPLRYFEKNSKSDITHPKVEGFSK